MEGSIILMILFQLLLIGLNAVFACAEIAVLSVSEAKLSVMASEGNKRAKRLLKLVSKPAGFLATIQVAITLSGFLGSAFAAENFSDGLVDWLISLGVGIPREALDTAAVLVITIILSYFTLVFGELVPKRIAMNRSEKMALGMSAPITFISKLFGPIVWLLTVSTNGVLRLLGIDPNADEEDVSEEEIRMMVDVGSEKGTIDHEEQKLIQNVFEFDDIAASDIATHRTDVLLLFLDDSDEDWQSTITNTRHTLYPVCDGSADSIVGILNANIYFRLQDKGRENVLKNAVTPAYFVPEGVKADVLFRNMKRTKNKLAVVLDEYGGMVGIVTINDLLQQIVGDIDGDAEVEIVKADGAAWRVIGEVTLKEIEDATGIKLQNDEYETLSGLVFGALGAVPEDGETPEVEVCGVKIVVTKLHGHQVTEALISQISTSDADER